MTSTQSFASVYDKDGFVFPIEVLSAEQAAAVRQDLENAEKELAGNPEKLALLHSYPDRLLPSFDELVRHPALVNAAAQILGPDLMVWSASLFIKQAQSTHIVSWHQDLTYWGLNDAEETTGWVALSDANNESGCMHFVPGSHKQLQVPHDDTFDDNNLLSRGQEIAVEVNEDEGVAVELSAGQASMHHGHLFHSSGPNRASYRRVGAAIRYIKPSMKQRSGDRSLVALVSGSDNYNHFTIAASPKGRLLEEDFERCRHDAEIKRRVLYEGAEGKKGKRY
jgi:ectoine hydroxylase-related dioxygenase (phytanoyl-CoA dioxygenase family)